MEALPPLTALGPLVPELHPSNISGDPGAYAEACSVQGPVLSSGSTSVC